MSTHDDAGWRTWPNLITAVRLAFLPVFLYVLFGTPHRALAAWLLGVLGATDWIDGWVARRLGQVSNFGKIFDPTADRILVIGGVLAVAGAGATPWWFAGVVLLREGLVSGLTLVLAALGARRIDVLWWGKVSTFILMFTFPAFLLCSVASGPAASWQRVGRTVTWTIGWIGLVMAWLVFAGYVRPALAALREGRLARQR